MLKSILLISAVFIASCQSQPTTETANSNTDTTMNQDTSQGSANTLTTEEKSQGWTLLFDGKTMGGWHVFNNKSDGSAWSVVDGTIHLNPTRRQDNNTVTVGGGDIVTEEEFENFHLKLDWKLDSAGNSGVMFYVKEEARFERTWHTGPEMQVLDNAAHPDAKITKHRAGDLYDLISSSPETVKPAGEWNEVEIISNKGSLVFRLNGTQVLSTTLWDENWKQLVAGSKFRDKPHFATFKSGKIALQDHGDPVWFRNLKIKKL